MQGINWLAVIVAAVSTFILGGLWYGPLFGKAWMRASGVSEEMVRNANTARTMGVSFVLELIIAAVLAAFIGPEASFGFAVAAAAAAGLFWVATALGVIYLFEQRSFGHWAINAGYQIIAFTLIGVILGVWR